MMPRGQIYSLTSLFLQKLGQSEPEIAVTILSPRALNDPDDPNVKIVSLFAGVFALSALGVTDAFEGALKALKMPGDMTLEQIEEMRIRQSMEDPFLELEVASDRRDLLLMWKNTLVDLAVGVARLTMAIDQSTLLAMMLVHQAEDGQRPSLAAIEMIKEYKTIYLREAACLDAKREALCKLRETRSLETVSEFDAVRKAIDAVAGEWLPTDELTHARAEDLTVTAAVTALSPAGTV
ncbi:MAG: hypothetical protein M1839_004710 [Geoglossum umbratile]|nr:MAG: hypothetical protein M1839_004710 [Geoglossum umbratile]